MKIVKRFLAIVSLLLIVFAAGCSTSKSSTTKNSSSATATAKARSLDAIKKSGTIKIGVFSDKKPFGYVDDKGKYQGYDVYFANRLAKDLGVKVKYVSVDPASRVEYLTSDFALPYMKVALGVVSPSNQLISDVDALEGKTLIVGKGTTAETYFEKHYPKVNLLKFDQYSEAYQALLDGRGDALSTDNTEVLAWALENKGYEVGITSLGDTDTIAPAVQKGNTELLDWINDEIKSLGDENFFHEDYDKTLAPVYGDAAKADDLVVESGEVD